MDISREIPGREGSGSESFLGSPTLSLMFPPFLGAGQQGPVGGAPPVLASNTDWREPSLCAGSVDWGARALPGILFQDSPPHPDTRLLEHLQGRGAHSLWEIEPVPRAQELRPRGL